MSRLSPFWIVAALLALGVEVVAVSLGGDATWDLRNYHLYAPFALLHKPFGTDIAPAHMQGFFSPTLDLIYYGLATSIPFGSATQRRPGHPPIRRHDLRLRPVLAPGPAPWLDGDRRPRRAGRHRRHRCCRPFHDRDQHERDPPHRAGTRGLARAGATGPARGAVARAPVRCRAAGRCRLRPQAHAELRRHLPSPRPLAPAPAPLVRGRDPACPVRLRSRVRRRRPQRAIGGCWNGCATATRCSPP